MLSGKFEFWKSKQVWSIILSTDRMLPNGYRKIRDSGRGKKAVEGREAINRRILKQINEEGMQGRKG